jgi:hypothetical protein
MKCKKCGFDDYENRRDRCTEDEVKSFCVELGLPPSDGEYLFNHWEAYEWRNGSHDIKNWKAVVRAWKAAGYLPSLRKPITEKPEPNWRRVLRQLYPNYGWIPTYFHDLPAEIKNAVKAEMK